MSLLTRAGRRPLGRILSTTTNSSNVSGNVNTRGIKSLAFTCWFKQPELGMTDYEYLSRGTASLLAVDPPSAGGEGPYGHLEAGEEKRQIEEFKRKHGFTPAMGAGTVSDMGWLEFVPREHRPNFHVVASSHVTSPFLWLDYYPHDWLTQVRQEHCKYTLDVFDTEKPGVVLGTYTTYNTPIHHPEGRDCAFLHLEEEEKALKEMKKLGVKPLYIRDPEKLFSKGETIYFDGYLVHSPRPSEENANDNDLTIEDTRIFEPYEEMGNLAFHTNDRFFADTTTPLPEGLCGAPAIDADGQMCGVVEGIIPLDHEDKKIAGSAAFLPSFLVASFVDYAERYMLEQLMPKDIFQSTVRAKETNTLGGGSTKIDGSSGDNEGWDEAFKMQVEDMKKKYSKEEVDAILWNVKREREEVMEIMNKEGGDLDEIIARVREKTLETREKVIDAYSKGEMPMMEEEPAGSEEGEDEDGREGKA